MSCSPSEGRGAWPVVFERPAQTHSEDEPDEADAPTSPHPAFCNHDNTCASHRDNRQQTRHDTTHAFTEIKGAVSNANQARTSVRPRLSLFLLIGGRNLCDTTGQISAITEIHIRMG